MKKFICFLIIILAFFIGRMSIKPKIIPKNINVKVYDFTQEPQIIEAYAHYIGKTLQNIEDIQKERDKMRQEIENEKLQFWQKGYQEGYQKATQTLYP